jgi:hypothetical protein
MRGDPGSLKVAAREQALHFPKESRICSEHVFEWPMSLTGFSKQDGSCFFGNLGVDYTWAFCESTCGLSSS